MLRSANLLGALAGKVTDRWAFGRIKEKGETRKSSVNGVCSRGKLQWGWPRRWMDLTPLAHPPQRPVSIDFSLLGVFAVRRTAAVIRSCQRHCSVCSSWEDRPLRE